MDLLNTIRAEIKERLVFCDSCVNKDNVTKNESEYFRGKLNAYKWVLEQLDTLEQEPQGLDEAAEFDSQKFGEGMSELLAVYVSPTDDPEEEAREYEYAIAKQFYNLGKQAGASWMAGQGDIVEGEIVEANPEGTSVPVVIVETEVGMVGDKVIVQIRKKEDTPKKKDWHEENASHGAFAFTQDEIDFYFRKKGGLNEQESKVRQLPSGRNYPSGSGEKEDAAE